MRSPVADLERLRVRARPPEPPVLRQRWQRLAFLHWAVDPLALAALLPAGLELDTWEGQAFVGIVPFAVRGTRAPFLPPIPFVSDFHEVNLRTYVHRRGRDPGVWFFSLDASSHLAVWGARAVYKLPYFHASIAMARARGGEISFRSRRRGSNGGDARFDCRYQPVSGPAEARLGTREFFLVERYLLYSWDGQRLRSARVSHDPYPIASARIAELGQDLTDAAGIAIAPGEAPLVHYADDVDVRIHAPFSVREGALELGGYAAVPRQVEELPAG